MSRNDEIKLGLLLVTIVFHSFAMGMGVACWFFNEQTLHFSVLIPFLLGFASRVAAAMIND